MAGREGERRGGDPRPVPAGTVPRPNGRGVAETDGGPRRIEGLRPPRGAGGFGLERVDRPGVSIQPVIRRPLTEQLLRFVRAEGCSAMRFACLAAVVLLAAPAASIAAPPAPVTALAYTPDGKLLAAGGAGEIALIDT